MAYANVHILIIFTFSCSFRFFLALYAWLFIMFALAAFSEDAGLLARTFETT